MKKRLLTLSITVALISIFLTSCVHVACMVGTACIPYIGPPKWVENVAQSTQTKVRTAAYNASLTKLHRAIRAGDAAKVEEILRTSPSQVHVTTSDKETPLELAITTQPQNPRIVKLLLGAGAGVQLSSITDQYQNGKSLLNQAVQVKVPQPEVITLLLDAGAEGFNPAKANVKYTFETPFGHVIKYTSPELVDAFLRTGKLNPSSDEAAEYLEYSARADWSFERMLKYGVPLERAPGILSEMVSKSTPNALQKGLQLSASFDSDKWRKASADALEEGVKNCKFEMANILFERNASNLKSQKFRSDLIRKISSKCGSDQKSFLLQEPHSGRVSSHQKPILSEELHSRSVFLHKLVVDAEDLNDIAPSNYNYCPAWIHSGDSTCKLPDSISLVKEYLALGADPYLEFNSLNHTTAIGLILNKCSPTSSTDSDLLALMLAQPPKIRNASNQLGLDLSLNMVFGASCSNLVRLDIADRLIAYGANVNALGDRGDTNLGATIFFKDDAVYSTAAAYLLTHGARIDEPNSYRKTVMYWLLDYEHPRMDRVLWLARHGARLENVLNQPVLPTSLRGPDRESIIAEVKANSK
jgi:ankyrin repeat protein